MVMYNLTKVLDFYTVKEDQQMKDFVKEFSRKYSEEYNTIINHISSSNQLYGDDDDDDDEDSTSSVDNVADSLGVGDGNGIDDGDDGYVDDVDADDYDSFKV